MESLCILCGSIFTHKSGKANKYCSLDCYWNYNRKEVSCPYCGKITKTFKKDKRIHCSRKCSNLHDILKRTKKCLFCRKNFYSSKINNKGFCSKKCYGKSTRTGQNKSCPICNKVFWVTKSLLKRKRVCSKLCLNKYQSLFFIKEKSPSWKGGIRKEKDRRKSYDGNMWRKAVFERDDYTCQICKERGGTLNADHIKPWILYPELRYELTNGRTLCVDCHRKTDTYGNRYNLDKIDFNKM